MKKTNLIAGALALTMAMGMFAGCKPTDDPNSSSAESGKPLAGNYATKIWVAEAAVEFTKGQIATYNSSNEDGIVIEATVEAVGEGEAATQMTTDVEAGADIFCFAQDQFARLVQAGALSQLGQAAGQIVSEANAAGVVAAAKSGDTLYAYPLTADNGYFMYYDKSVITDESHLKSMELLLADCEAAGKNFSFEVEGSAWYVASFFFATDCKSEWTTDEDGKFISVNDTYNSPEGLKAVKGLHTLVKSKAYNNSSAADAFAAAVPSAVLVSGTWAYNDILEILGENLGVAELPSFTVGEETFHLGSFSGCKLLGVKPQQDAKRSAALHKFAQYLTGEAAQIERFNTLSWGPSNLNAQKIDAVQANPALAALLAQSAYSIPQGQIHGTWWDIGKTIATGVKASDGTDAGLQAVLDTYKAAIEGLFTMSDEEKNAFTVIGSINGDTWTIDLPMTKVSEGVWKTTEAYALVENDEFKVRQGKSWDVAYGDNGQNYKVTTAGTYYIQLTIEGEVGTIELIPA
ncbi:MAG: extracellular solute-binding protein [Clostridia bacterium]|nr:extracellular solute-binding protein [Clostridia bacterium]